MAYMTRRPAELLGRLVGGLFLAAVRRSRLVQDARSSLGDWEKARRQLEPDCERPLPQRRPIPK